ncbi:MAG TPA: hypothetical protein VHV55_09745, partial [Pirellulales bacterium]|nr:hypothetical protein [Pirellulales bacterium]
MAKRKRPIRPKWRRRRPVVLTLPDGPKQRGRWRRSVVDFLFRTQFGQILFALIVTLFVFLTVLVLEADNDDKAGGVWCRGGSALPAIAASADGGSQFAALILDRYPRRVYGCAARRRGGRTKADVEREQREL